MSAVTTNAVVATIALVAVLTRTARAIILVPCPTFFASSFVHYINFDPHFLLLWDKIPRQNGDEQVLVDPRSPPQEKNCQL